MTARKKELTLGALTDKLIDIRDARLAKQQEVDALKAEQSELETRWLASAARSDVTRSTGLRATVSRNEGMKYAPVDWIKISDWVIDDGDPAVFQKRLNEGFLKELEEEDIIVPGVEKVKMVRVSITKSNR